MYLKYNKQIMALMIVVCIYQIALNNIKKYSRPYETFPEYELVLVRVYKSLELSHCLNKMAIVLSAVYSMGALNFI